jgi:hypothetical protein
MPLDDAIASTTGPTDLAITSTDDGEGANDEVM